MNTICQEKNCHKCCNNTNMHLTKKDISRISQKLHTASFYLKNEEGWLQLMNKDGVCIFHDGKECTIYDIRPLGCRLYPLVYNIDDQKVVYDSICPYQKSFPKTSEKIRQLKELINILFTEFNKRNNMPGNNKDSRMCYE